TVGTTVVVGSWAPSSRRPVNSPMMTIRAYSRSDDFSDFATYLHLALDAVQRRLGRRVAFGTARKRVLLVRRLLGRIIRLRIATAAGLLGLALSLWSTPGASALTRLYAARAHSGSLGRHHTMPDWLATINRYRAAAGLAAASDQPAWDAGLEH